jgi:hypothetical protein
MLASVMIHSDAKRRLDDPSSLTGFRISARIAEGMGSIPMKVIFFFVLSHNISDTGCPSVWLICDADKEYDQVRAHLDRRSVLPFLVRDQWVRFYIEIKMEQPTPQHQCCSII